MKIHFAIDEFLLILNNLMQTDYCGKMQIIESNHWKLKKIQRTNIENYMIEEVIKKTKKFEKDKKWSNALNAIKRIRETGKLLKVVFRFIGKNKIKLITAYYLD